MCRINYNIYLLFLFTFPLIISCSKVEVKLYDYNPHIPKLPKELKDFEELSTYTYKPYSIPISIKYVGNKKENLRHRVNKNKSIVFKDDELVIRGSACDFPNLSSPIKVYVLFNSKLYPMKSQLATPKLEKHFGIASFDKCGFEGVIPVNKELSGDHSVHFIFMTNEQEVYYIKHTSNKMFPKRILTINFDNV